MELGNNIVYIGVNDKNIDLFEGMYHVPNGMAYNSYVIIDEKIAVMDTVDGAFGEEWPTAIRAALSKHPQLLEKWNVINQTYNAYRLWNTAHEVIANPLSERVRAQVQADMPEYETYLPMFGEAGTELLAKLRTFVSSLN